MFLSAYHQLLHTSWFQLGELRWLKKFSKKTTVRTLKVQQQLSALIDMNEIKELEVNAFYIMDVYAKLVVRSYRLSMALRLKTSFMFITQQQSHLLVRNIN